MSPMQAATLEMTLFLATVCTASRNNHFAVLGEGPQQASLLYGRRHRAFQLGEQARIISY
jgi:hypothetical protein